MHCRSLPRRRLQRAFFHWLIEKGRQLPFPLVVVRRTDSNITCRMGGINDAIRIVLADDLCVYVERDGEFWDALLWLDCQPQKHDNHYVCTFCPPGLDQRFGSRESLWRSRLFDPLAAWMQTLRSSQWLLLFETRPGGSSWARLSANTLSGQHQNLVARLPVHVTRNASDGGTG